MKQVKWIFQWILMCCITSMAIGQTNPDCEAIGITEPLGFNTSVIPNQVFPGDDLCVEFAVENFNSVIAFQYTFNFDPTQLCYSSFFIANGTLTGPLAANIQEVETGIVSFIWSNLNAEGQSLPDGTVIFSLCFNACGDPNECEELGFNNVLAPQFPSIEVNYQVNEMMSCSHNTILLDGQETSCIDVACDALSIINLSVCNSQNNQGSIDFQICGGTAPYSWELRNAMFPNPLAMGTIDNPFEAPTGLGNFPAATFTLIVTDATGTNVSRPVIIENIDAVSFDNPIIVQPVCSDVPTGSITIQNITSGLPGELFDINFSNGLTLQDVNEFTFENLDNGDYTVTITDSFGCETVETITLFVPPLDVQISTMEATCQGANDGYLSITVSGGTPDGNGEYTINGLPGNFYETDSPFQDGAFSPFTNLYRIRVVDSNGCRFDADIDIPVMNEVEVEFTELIDVNCTGESTGSISASVLTPGTYSFIARDEDNNLIGVGGVLGGTELVGNPILAAGRYELEISDFNTGCSLDTFFIINEPPDSLKLTPMATEASCGGNDAEISVQIEGGMSPYIIDWEDFPNISDPNVPNVGNGSYRVTVTDDLGCIKDTVVVVDSDNTLEIQASIVDNISCDGSGQGLLQVDVLNSSSTEDPSFSWQDLGGQELGVDNMLSITDPGDYVIVVTTNDNNCEARDTIMILNDAELNFEFNITNASCEFGTNGMIEIFNIQGGTPPYDCMWENISITSCNPTALMPGMYPVTIVDAQGCPKDTIFEIGIDPSEITFDIIPFPISCPGEDDAMVEIINFAGGQGPYQCVWADPTITSCNPTNLGPGIYDFVIIDGAGCTKDTFIQIVEPPLQINFDLDIVNPTCSGDLGSIEIQNLDGANLPISVLWSDPNGMDDMATNLMEGDITISFADARGCTFDSTVTLIRVSDELIIDIDAVLPECGIGPTNGSITFPNFDPNGTCDWGDPDLNSQNCTLVGLAPGFYNVTLTDSQGCSKDTFIDMMVDTLKIELDSTLDPECFGVPNGQATVDVTEDPRGIGTYSFMWSNPADNGNGVIGEAMTLPSGQNFVVAFDGLCSSDTIFFDLSEPDPILFDLDNTTITNINCAGECNGEVSLAASGGTSLSGDYSFNWEDGISAQTRDDLCIGTYIVTITDDNNCELEQTIIIEEPTILTARIDSANVINLDCSGEDNGVIVVSAEGGCGNYSYAWTDNVSTTERADQLGVGLYEIIVTDDCGCTTMVEYNMESTEELTALPLDFEPPLCVGDQVCIGIDPSSVTGGTNANYTYSINLGNRLPIDSCLMVNPGVYNLRVFDSPTCFIELVVNVPEPSSFSVDLGEDMVVDIGGDPQEVIGVLSGGQPDFTFDWFSESEFSCVDIECSIIEVLPTTFSTYELIVTDQNGCTTRDQINIDVETRRNVYIANTFNPDEQPPNDKFIPLTGVGVEELEVFRVYDRWGNLIYEIENLPAPTNIDDGWNGRKGNSSRNDVIPGVYVYHARVRFIDGVSIDYSGDITLLK